MKNKTILDETAICDEYTNSKIGVEALALKCHVGKKRIKEILEKNGISAKKRGAQPNNEKFTISDWKVKKYGEVQGKHWMAVDSNTGFKTKDVYNDGGQLTTYIRNTYGVETPTLYDRRMYYMRTGNYWWEQWFTIEAFDDEPTKKCPYCNWETMDTENNSGAFELHLWKKHGISKAYHIKEHPEDKGYFSLANPSLNTRLFETDPHNIIECKVCGKKFVRMSRKHLAGHGMTKEEYILKYGMWNAVAQSYSEKMSENAKAVNENMAFHKVSSKELELVGFINSLGFEVKQDRKVLGGQELDIYIPSKGVAIEFDGLYWHSEIYKDKDYHVSKTDLCAKNGIRLIHIFEDEWDGKKDITKSRLRNILGLTGNRLYARGCEVKDVSRYDAEIFLSANHIQGSVNSTYRYGLYHGGELVSLMAFGGLRKVMNSKSEEGRFEMLRFCNKLDTTVVGGAGKLLRHFINEVKPNKIISYADKRWSDGNLYRKLGFTHVHDSKPSYFYVLNGKRLNRFSLRKDVLVERYGCPKGMSEHDFCLSKRWYRIYDCGTMKFELNNLNSHD